MPMYYIFGLAKPFRETELAAYCCHVHTIFQIRHDLLDPNLQEGPCCPKVVLVRSWRHGDRHLGGICEAVQGS